jgi:hypothetical protein
MKSSITQVKSSIKSLDKQGGEMTQTMYAHKKRSLDNRVDHVGNRVLGTDYKVEKLNKLVKYKEKNTKKKKRKEKEHARPLGHH